MEDRWKEYREKQKIAKPEIIPAKISEVEELSSVGKNKEVVDEIKKPIAAKIEAPKVE